MFKKGDIVTRNSYNNDVIFKIIEINNDNCILKGVNVRLMADCPIADLKVSDRFAEDDDEINLDLSEFYNSFRSGYFYLPGKVLHVDGDKEYLDRCLNFYEKNKVRVNGFYMDENKMEDNITQYLQLYNPDILVITGHDAYFSKRSSNDYKNTNNFINTIKNARRYEKSHEKLIIVAGACQSNYEELIKAGANFASSPKRINIHALDPAVVATSMAFAKKNEDIDLFGIINKTKYKEEGIGGIITKGTMYVGYPRE